MTITNEQDRLAAAKRVTEIRAELRTIQDALAYIGKTPIDTERAQALVTRRQELDSERLALEVALRGYRDPKVSRFIREVREYVQLEGEKHQLKAGLSESCYEGDIERSAANPDQQAQFKRALENYRRWSNEGYKPLEALSNRASAAQFAPFPIEDELKGCARSFAEVRSKFTAPTLMEQLLGGGR